jgi:antitoxin component of MazEF toxin-antitoxin module
MAVEIMLRRWGNSIGAVFPKSFVEEMGLKADEIVVVEVIKKADLKEVFGSLKMKGTAQQMKDEARKAWD